MNDRRCFPARAALGLPLALSALLAGCGANDPAPAGGAMARSAAEVTMVVLDQEEYAATLQQLYIAYFGRPAEPAGLEYWNRQLRQMLAPVEPGALAARYRSDARVRAVFDAFAGSQESQQLYPGTTAQFVDGVYRNLFNRAPDLAGLAYWTNAIDAGILTRSEAALAIMLGAQNDDALCVRNKLAVATTFYRILTERAQTILAYTGNNNNAIARQMMSLVDAKTDLAAFEATIRAAIGQMELNTRG